MTLICLNAAKIHNMDYKSYFEKGISYEVYKENFQNEMDSGTSSYAQYLPQNWQRQSRLDRKLKLTKELSAAISKVQSPLHWLVVTEHWCGDASQINPIVAKVAEGNPEKIKLRFVYRDQNTALIDAHLTDGRSRSIPMLLQLDENFQLISSYGPRPAEAQKLVKSILAENGDYNIPLHTWYAKDKQKTIQVDLEKFL